MQSIIAQVPFVEKTTIEKGTVVNSALQFLHGELFKITVHKTKNISVYCQKFKNMFSTCLKKIINVVHIYLGDGVCSDIEGSKYEFYYFSWKISIRPFFNVISPIQPFRQNTFQNWM